MENHYRKFDHYGLRHLPEHLIEIHKWDVLTQLLCDLFFIEVKCSTGMAYELVDNYNTVMNALPKCINSVNAKHPTNGQKAELPDVKLSSDSSIPFRMPWSESKIKNEIERMKNHPTRSDTLEIFSRFVNRVVHQLDKFSKTLPMFCFQEAYNSADSGPVAEQAPRRMLESKKAPFVLRQPFSLPEFNPCPALLRTMEKYTSVRHAMAISSKKRIVVMGSTDRKLKIFDFFSGGLIEELKGEPDIINSVAVTPDGKYALTGGRRTLRLWDLENQICLRALNEHTGDKSVRLWNAETGVCDKIFSGHTGSIYRLCLTPDEKTAISGGDDGMIFWNLETGAPIKSYGTGRPEKGDVFEKQIRIENGLLRKKNQIDPVIGMDVAADGRRLISGGLEKTVRIWDIDTDECIKELKGHTDIVNSVCITPCGGLAASGSDDRTVRIWNTNTGECLRKLEGHSEDITAVYLTSDGIYAASGGGDQTIKIWNVRSGCISEKKEAHTDEVVAVAITHDGKSAITGGNDNDIRIWSMDTGECIHILKGHYMWVCGIKLTPDRKHIVSYSLDETVRIWDIEDGHCIHVLDGNSGYTGGFELTPDGKNALIEGVNSNLLNIWDISSGRCLLNLEGHTDGVRTVRVSRDGRFAVSCGIDKTIRAWDIQTGECLHVLKGHKEAVYVVEISPDGKLIVSGSVDFTIKIWNMVSGACIATLKGHEHVVNSLKISPYGDFILSASPDETLRRWEMRTGLCTSVYHGLTGLEILLDLLPDGKRMITGGNEETLQIRDIQTGELLAVLNHSAKATSFALKNNDLVVGDSMGNVIFYKLHQLEAAYAATESVRLWKYENSDWDEKITSKCEWCGIRFSTPDKILERINAISDLFPLSFDQSPCLELPPDIIDDPDLFSTCPECGKRLKFPPFIVDNSRWSP